LSKYLCPSPSIAMASELTARDVYEPLAAKEHIINSATEVASMILRIDDVIAASKSKDMPPGPDAAEGPEGYGGGTNPTRKS
jgi:archaeal chaperonin